jgi:hypothetical protein
MKSDLCVSSAPICAPARVLEVELLDRDWRVATSSDGVEIEIAHPRARSAAARNSGIECAPPTNNNPGLQGDSKTQRLARALLRDRAPSAKPPAPTCFTCGRSYWRGDGRFCSTRCREGFDAGFPPYDPNYADKTNPRWYSLPIGRHGFLIDCANCKRRFDSIGLRCCSTKCEGLLSRKEKRRKASQKPPKITSQKQAPTRPILRGRGKGTSPHFELPKVLSKWEPSPTLRDFSDFPDIPDFLKRSESLPATEQSPPLVPAEPESQPAEVNADA